MTSGGPPTAMAVGIYCPALPPAPGGLPDHTLTLARSLASGGVSVITLGKHGDPAAFHPLTCRVGIGLDGGPSGLVAAAVSLGLGAVILQYVPFLYARFGIAPSLVRAARDLRGRGIRLAVIVHEPYVPFTRLPWLVTGLPMRWQFRALMRLADVIYSPVPRFLELARPAARPEARLAVAPVGSAIPIHGVSRSTARASLGLSADDVAIGVFSPAAAGLCRQWVARAAGKLASEPSVVWVLFGNGSESAIPGLSSAARIKRLGYLRPERVSGVLQALDLAVAPFVDGLSLRRSSALAVLAHGVPLISSQGPHFDPCLADGVVGAPSCGAFVAAVREFVHDGAKRGALGEAGRRVYREHGSADLLAARLVGDLVAR